MGKKKPICIYIDEDYISMIDGLVKKIGHGASRNGWIADAVEKQLKIEMGLSILWKKGARTGEGKNELVQ